MGKKNKPDPVAPNSALTHNPFAALARHATIVEPAEAAKATLRTAEPSPPLSERAHEDASPNGASGPGSSPPPKGQGRVVLRRETKHRGGKAVIVVTGFSALPRYDEPATRELAQKLKQRLGCGGTVETRDGEREIVLQGDHAAKVAELLRGLGFRVDGVTR